MKMLMLPRRTLLPGLLLDVFLVIVVLFLLLTFTNRSGHLTSNDPLQRRDFVECLPSSHTIRQKRIEAAADESDYPEGEGSAGNRSHGRDASDESDAYKAVYIDQRLKIIKDPRSRECRKVNYDVRETVTIILHFNDYQLNDLKNTIGSILLHTDMRRVEEIIVVDDASSLDHIVKDAVQYFRRIPRVRLLRNQASDQAGVARVRTMAAKEAKTGVLVFLDSWTICNRGWLEPLVDLLATDQNAVAVPHFDRIHDPVSLDYVVETDRQIASLSWNLAIRVRPPAPDTRSAANGHFHHSPAVRGNAFAVRKEFFLAVGAYDAGLDGDGGGEHAEFSVRAWLCSGSVKVAHCSRVGLLNLFDPVKVSSRRNVRRIAERWFGARKATVYRSFGLTKSEAARIDVGPDGKDGIKFLDRCRDIDWFLSNVATNMIAPSGDAVRFGILRVRTDRCSRLLPAFERVKLDECRQEHFTRHRPEMLFELTGEGHLKVMGKCLTTKDNAYILAERCRPGDTKQRWRYRNEELVNVWCNYCATHVTDPDPRMEGDKQILMAQECGSDGSNLFKKWEFLLP